MAKKTRPTYLWLLIAVESNRVRDTWLLRSNRRSNLSVEEAVSKARSPFWQGEGKQQKYTYDLVPIEPKFAMRID